MLDDPDPQEDNVIRKLTLAVGFAGGYVLGTRAGKERYAQIQGKVRVLLGQPAVQDFTSSVSSTASAAADKAKATVNDKVEAVGDKVAGSSGSPDVVVDLGGHGASRTPTPVTTIPVLSTTPVVGAAPSMSAPDVV